MQVTPLPVPVLPTALPQDAVSRSIPQIAAQAAAPLLQRAVDPSSGSDKGQKSRTNQERANGGKGGAGDGRQRGSKVNIDV